MLEKKLRSTLLQCSNCAKILESPVLLPCGDSVCKKHTTNESNEAILCLKCEIEHPLHANVEFLPNNALAEIIEFLKVGNQQKKTNLLMQFFVLFIFLSLFIMIFIGDK